MYPQFPNPGAVFGSGFLPRVSEHLGSTIPKRGSFQRAGDVNEDTGTTIASELLLVPVLQITPKFQIH